MMAMRAAPIHRKQVTHAGIIQIRWRDLRNLPDNPGKTQEDILLPQEVLPLGLLAISPQRTLERQKRHQMDLSLFIFILSILKI